MSPAHSTSTFFFFCTKHHVQSVDLFCMWCSLRLYVRNFWSHEKRLPPATLERLLMVLNSLYSTQIEERFLSLATDLLLEMTSQSPDYTRNMFEFPLSECKFLVRFFVVVLIQTLAENLVYLI